jgi:acyl carrier protein
MREHVEDTVRRFIQQRFPHAGSAPLRADAPLFSSGIVDSFGVLELIAFLEERFGIDINPARHDLTEFDTLSKIGSLVERLDASGGAS